MSEQNKMQEMISSSLESIRAMVDANTVVGTPIETASGTTIIPISKIAVGYAAGGTDYTANKVIFAGGGGTGLSVQPVCFIAVDTTGDVEVLPLGNTAGGSDSVDRIVALLEKTPDIVAKIKAMFGTRKKKKEEKKAAKEVAKAAADAVRAVEEEREKAAEESDAE